MTDSSETYLIRLGPPSQGDMIHTNECRYAAVPHALRWAWADQRGIATIDWDALRRHGIRACRRCRPDLLSDSHLLDRELLR